MKINAPWSDFLALVFPVTCVACNKTLVKGEEHLCLFCHASLPKTFYFKDSDNPIGVRFWGKVPVSMVFSFLKFNKGNITQRVLYQIKYRSRTDAAVYLGHLLGQDLKQHFDVVPWDVVVPVPLHWKKLKKRGYNQSALFSEGISLALDIKHEKDALARVVHNATQTNKSRQARWENVKDIFQVTNTMDIKDKHVLLVDDVVTTGATLEVCAVQLLKAGASQVSIAAIASAE
jgi:ComF family protein